MIEILDGKLWKQTGWSSFKQLEKCSERTKNVHLDNEYNYIMTEFNDELEFYRQKKEPNLIELLKSKFIIYEVNRKYYINCNSSKDITTELEYIVKELEKND